MSADTMDAGNEASVGCARDRVHEAAAIVSFLRISDGDDRVQEGEVAYACDVVHRLLSEASEYLDGIEDAMGEAQREVVSAVSRARARKGKPE
jgi:predicted translin family RNA/ssDNA-binding protein